MNLSKMKRVLSVSALIGIWMFTGCAAATATGIQNGILLSERSSSDTDTKKDSTTEENFGYVDYSVYEAYGLVYDEKMDCYTYNGSIVRFFNDPAAGASFTNFFTGTVDIEAKRDGNDKLIGIEECSQEVYDRHTKKQKPFQRMTTGAELDAALQARKDPSDGEWLKDYEDQGVSYNGQNGRWYYDGDKIRMLIDNERTYVYYTDEKGACLVVSRDEHNAIAEIKIVSEDDAKLLLQANKPNAAGNFTVEED